MNLPEKGKKLRSPEKKMGIWAEEERRREGERGGVRKMEEENMKML